MRGRALTANSLLLIPSSTRSAPQSPTITARSSSTDLRSGYDAHYLNPATDLIRCPSTGSIPDERPNTPGFEIAYGNARPLSEQSPATYSGHASSFDDYRDANSSFQLKLTTSESATATPRVSSLSLTQLPSPTGPTSAQAGSTPTAEPISQSGKTKVSPVDYIEDLPTSGEYWLYHESKDFIWLVVRHTFKSILGEMAREVFVRPYILPVVYKIKRAVWEQLKPKLDEMWERLRPVQKSVQANLEMAKEKGQLGVAPPGVLQ